MSVKTLHIYPIITTSAVPYQELHSTFEFNESHFINLNAHRTIGGQLNHYRLPGEGVTFTVPLTFVNCETRGMIHSWWKDRVEVALTLNGSSSPFSTIGRIMNEFEPLSMRSQMNYTDYDGVLVIQTTRATAVTSGAYFIVDDVIFGLLDQAYNPLG